MAAVDEFLMVGGEDGSFTFMNLRTCDNPIYDSFTTEHCLEVNGIEITRSRTGSTFCFCFEEIIARKERHVKSSLIS